MNVNYLTYSIFLNRFCLPFLIEKFNILKIGLMNKNFKDIFQWLYFISKVIWSGYLVI